MVSVLDDGSNGPDQDMENNVYTETTIVNDAPEMAIVKDDGVSVVAPGETITYVLAVSNNGNRDATGVVVTDWLPEYVSLSGVSDGGNETFPGSGVVTWPAFNLPKGASVIRTLVATLQDPFPDGVAVLTNTARVADDGLNGDDLLPENNIYTLMTIVDAAPDLVVSKIGQPPSFPPTLLAGQMLTYTISISNTGNQNATRVVLTDTLPDHTLFSYASHNGIQTGGIVTWSIDKLDVGTFAAMCEAYSEFVRVSKQLKKEMKKKNSIGPVVKTKKGNWVQHPLLGVKNQAAERYLKFAQQFGMTPAARAKIAEDQITAADKLKKYMSS